MPKQPSKWTRLARGNQGPAVVQDRGVSDDSEEDFVTSSPSANLVGVDEEGHCLLGLRSGLRSLFDFLRMPHMMTIAKSLQEPVNKDTKVPFSAGVSRDLAAAKFPRDRFSVGLSRAVSTRFEIDLNLTRQSDVFRIRTI